MRARARAPVADSRHAPWCLLVLCLLSSCASARGASAADALLHERLGGDTTAFTATRNAFSLSARNLTNAERRQFEVGDSFFEQNWVAAPASTAARDGLGPTFNAPSCSSCHALDGRARPPAGPEDTAPGLLIRLSVPGALADGRAPGDPRYGTQLQDRALPSIPVEGRVAIRYEEIHGAYADGEPYTLLAPRYELEDLAFGPLHPDARLSPRVGPAVIGLGLLEAIPEPAIRALADPDDRDGDGISGRPNEVWDVRRGAMALGRFGWKANVPTVEQQVAAAFHGDVGITSTLFPDENCPPVQTDCRAALHGGVPEVPDERLLKVVFYTRTLAVPAMRDVDDPEVRAGARAFLQAGCAKCHAPTFTTGEHAIPALSHQVIYPYTDLLLHDMGEGLADGRPDFQATGREWRTPPLWGIGLVPTVNRHTRFLHDGRARNLAEAILWHEGEGAAAREAFRTMPRAARAALLRFLESL